MRRSISSSIPGTSLRYHVVYRLYIGMYVQMYIVVCVFFTRAVFSIDPSVDITKRTLVRAGSSS